MRTKSVSVFFLAVMTLAAATPAVLAQSDRSVSAARPFPGDIRPATAPGSGSPDAGGLLSPGTSGIPGAANWLLTQQDVSGGFPWTVGGAVFGNTQGPTALGMLGAYEVDGDPRWAGSMNRIARALSPVRPPSTVFGAGMAI